jgi:hypothetical protein
MYHDAEVSGDITELNTEILKKYLFQAIITKTLMTLIVVRNLSFYIVKWAEFHILY